MPLSARFQAFGLAQTMNDAFGQTLAALGLVDRNDPIASTVADKIVELVQRGVSDKNQLVAQALSEMTGKAA